MRRNDGIRNQILFPIIVLSCWVTGFYLNSLLLFGVAVYYLFFLFTKKSYELLFFCLLMSGLLLGRMLFFKNDQLIEGPLSAELLVHTDTIRVNGDLISFEGKLSEGKVIVRYFATNEIEKQRLETRGEQWQKWRIEGSFEKAEKNRNLHAFDYANQLFASNHLGIVVVDTILHHESNQRRLNIRQLRADAITHVKKAFPPKLAVYCNALLFGYKDADFQEIRKTFSRTGILHLFTISGMHVAVFLNFCSVILRKIGCTANEMLFPLILLVAGAVFIFGASISVIRAGLFFLVSYGAKLLKVRLSAMDKFAVVLFLLLLVDPKVWLQLGGQLSLIMSFLMLVLQSVSVKRIIRLQFLPVLAAPLMMSFFYELPLLGGLLTTLMLPVFQKIVLPFFFLLFCASTFLEKTTSIYLAAEAILYKFEALMELFQEFKIITGHIPLVIAAIFMAAGIYYYQRKAFYRCFMVSLLLPIFYQWLSVPEAVSFVDVGQGDSVVIQARNNREVFVIDTGGKLEFSTEDWKKRSYQAPCYYTLLPFLKGEGVRKIDGLFLTHGHIDHMGDALSLMAEIPVKTLFIPRGNERHPNLAEMIEQIPNETKIVLVDAGMTIGEKISLQVLAPRHIGMGENEDSLVLHTEIKEMNFLFTGDLYQEGEEQLLVSYPTLTIDVLQLGHHGSNTSTSPLFIQEMQPGFGIVSCGKDNRYGHPHQEAIEILEEQNVEILRTDKQGMIRFSWKKRKKSPSIRPTLDY